MEKEETKNSVKESSVKNPLNKIVAFALAAGLIGGAVGAFLFVRFGSSLIPTSRQLHSFPTRRSSDLRKSVV